MENLVTSREVEPGKETQQKNIFKELVPDAKSTLRRVMLNGHDLKLSATIAESILDRAGETKKTEVKQQTNIMITSSEVQLLIQAAKEVANEV
jgi:hypothetical protein